MEKYYRVSDVNDIIKKLSGEPYYQHNGESFYNGVCAVDGELMCLEQYPIREGEWIIHTNYEGNINHYECSVCHQAQGHKSNYCEKCGADMRGEVE
jgi:hypothetical protein